MNKKRFWLLKSEPDLFSVDDLKNARRSSWDGVRNFQARNFIRDDMKIGDLALFYHSSCEEPGAAGVARVASHAYPDPSAFDPKSPYFDPKSNPENPTWWMIDVEFVEKFPHSVSLKKMHALRELSGLPLLRKGQRLSILPVSEAHFKKICGLGRTAANLRGAGQRSVSPPASGPVEQSQRPSEYRPQDLGE